MFAGKGVPNRRARENIQTRRVSSSVVPTADVAVQRFSAMGGKLTIFSPFGSDPLADHPALAAQREVEFSSSVPPFSAVFHAIVNGNDRLFREGVRRFIYLTDRLTP